MHGVVLLSGGIDSPVAAGVLLERGVTLSAVFFDALPDSHPEHLEKIIRLRNILQERFNTKLPLYQIPHKENLKEIRSKCSERAFCVLCRRMMLRISSKLGKQKGMDFLVTGESLGQVASQTLSNIRCENTASSLLILRPLIGLDKIEIERRALEFGTYEVSIQPGLYCSLAPKYPLTKSVEKTLLTEENKLDLLLLVENAVENTKIIKY